MPKGEVQAARTHCPAGHEYSFANTLVSHGRDGYTRRTCRRCRRDRQRDVYRAIMAAARLRGNW